MNVKFCLIETENGSIKVDIVGNGKDLVNVIASAISYNEDIAEILSMGLIASAINEGQQVEEDNDDDFVEMLKGMKIGLA
jgi:hypothetical protein